MAAVNYGRESSIKVDVTAMVSQIANTETIWIPFNPDLLEQECLAELVNYSNRLAIDPWHFKFSDPRVTSEVINGLNTEVDVEAFYESKWQDPVTCRLRRIDLEHMRDRMGNYIRVGMYASRWAIKVAICEQWDLRMDSVKWKFNRVPRIGITTVTLTAKTDSWLVVGECEVTILIY